MIGQEDTPLPMGKFNVAPFGPTGIINNNDLSTTGQGLKKMFNPQMELPRQFLPKDVSMGNKRGSSSGVLGGGGRGGGYYRSRQFSGNLSTNSIIIEL